MGENKFIEKFKGKRSEELEQILEEKHKYTEAAILAARTLLENKAQGVRQEKSLLRDEVDDSVRAEEDGLEKAVEDAQNVKILEVVNFDHASKNKRFANFLLDSFFLYLLTFGIFFIVAVFLALLDPSYVDSLVEMNLLVQYLFSFTISISYFTLFEMYTGATLAKLITKTRVVRDDGKKPSKQEFLVRSLCRFIPFEAFSFLGDGPNGWHDNFSNTIVVNIGQRA